MRKKLRKKLRKIETEREKHTHMYTRMIANEFLLLVQELFLRNRPRSGMETNDTAKKKKKFRSHGRTRTMNISCVIECLLPTELNLVIILPSLKKNKLYNNMPTQWHHISTVIIFSGCASIMRRSLRFTTDSTQTDTNWPGSTG